VAPVSQHPIFTAYATGTNVKFKIYEVSMQLKLAFSLTVAKLRRLETESVEMPSKLEDTADKFISLRRSFLIP
jgi:hypothetical protein